MRFIDEIVRDTLSLARTYGDGKPTGKAVLLAVAQDGTLCLAISRVRQLAQRWRIPGVSGVLRRAQTMLYGIEISNDAVLGEGIMLTHTVGTVIGGNARLGDRVMLLGSVTLGSIHRDDFPTIGNDVIIGAGARVLGRITIGDGALIGANAVVTCDVPAGATAVGVPAVVRGPSSSRAASLSRQ